MRRLALATAIALILVIMWPTGTGHSQIRSHASRPSTTTAPPVVTTTTTAPIPIASTTTSTSSPAPVPATQPVAASSPDLMTEWSRVATCEEGGFGNYGFPNYPDSLGIDATNWAAYGGGSDLSPDAQIAVAERMVQALDIGVPDQSGCSAW